MKELIQNESFFQEKESVIDRINPFKIGDFKFGLQEIKRDPFVFGFMPTRGSWTGDRGDSVWIPDFEHRPEPKTINNRENPSNLTWLEIMDKYKIEGVLFKDNYPDFSPISVGNVDVQDFTSDRQKNFFKADSQLAEYWTIGGKDNREWTPDDIKIWRKENNYTWHECENCRTMQLVPTEIHNNIPHEGGISVKKKQEMIYEEV